VWPLTVGLLIETNQRDRGRHDQTWQLPVGRSIDGLRYQTLGRCRARSPSFGGGSPHGTSRLWRTIPSWPSFTRLRAESHPFGRPGLRPNRLAFVARGLQNGSRSKEPHENRLALEVDDRARSILRGIARHVVGPR
jgi:hypothetical protein